MYIFNDDDGFVDSEGSDDKVGPRTYMIVFKKVDIEKIRYAPVNSSAVEKKVIRQYVLQQSETVDEA
jgi:hypothetical protein